MIPRKKLSISNLSKDPFRQFGSWFKRARRNKKIEYPDAMTLSTIDKRGYPDGRVVLLKEFSKKGFVFFTNLESVKAQSLFFLPGAALTFYWEPLGYQVRIQGKTRQVSGKEADLYFSTRPRDSQISAWASNQSRQLKSRTTLEKRFKEFKKLFEGREIVRPSYWSGFKVIPFRFEFWVRRASRMHDRFLYTRGNDGKWRIKRLYP